MKILFFFIVFFTVLSACDEPGQDHRSTDFELAFLDDVSPVQVRYTLAEGVDFPVFTINDTLNPSTRTYPDGEKILIFYEPGEYLLKLDATDGGRVLFHAEKEIVIPPVASKLKIIGFTLDSLSGPMDSLTFKKGDNQLSVELVVNHEIISFYETSFDVADCVGEVVYLPEPMIINLEEMGMDVNSEEQSIQFRILDASGDYEIINYCDVDWTYAVDRYFGGILPTAGNGNHIEGMFVICDWLP